MVHKETNLVIDLNLNEKYLRHLFEGLFTPSVRASVAASLGMGHRPI